MWQRMKKRRPKHAVNPITIPVKPLVEWALDYMSDALDNGRRFRTLNVIDHFNRQCMGIAVGSSLSSHRAVDLLERLVEKYGKPGMIRTDNGSEFTSKRFQLWLHQNNIGWNPIEKGKPQQNCIIERFNRTYREDVLDANLFDSVAHAQLLTQKLIKQYNYHRPHEALNNLTPIQYAA